MKTYCSSCGHPNESSASSPARYCNRCGEPMGAAFKKTVSAEKPTIKAVQKIVQPTLARFKDRYKAVENEDEDDGPFEIAQPSLADTEIVVTNKLTVGSLQNIQTPIGRGANPMAQNVPADIEVTSKNLFANLE